jgi:hypothetical protein
MNSLSLLLGRFISHFQFATFPDIDMALGMSKLFSIDFTEF